MGFDTLILSIVSICLGIYWFYKKSFSYFEKRNVPHLKPNLFFGNIEEAVMKKKVIHEVYADIYHKLEPHRIIGFYNLYKPMYMVRDPELIKTMFIKDFEYFPDRGAPLGVEDEPLISPLANMTGEKWKNYRIKLTPTFTTGKMKKMFPLMKVCGNNLIEFLGKLNPNDDLEVKGLCFRLIADVIATTTFGLETNTVVNPKSEFHEVIKNAVKPRIQATIRSYFPSMPIKMIKYLKLFIYDSKTAQYFSQLVRNSVKYREENQITRNDFLDMLMDMKNNTDNKIEEEHEAKDLKKFLSEIGTKTNTTGIDMTFDLMASQCFAFFLSGSESTSTTLGFLIFELARNPDIQKKVRDEINAVWTSEEEVTYEKMKEMKYTDMVISEIFRQHPPFALIMRRCGKSYKIPESDIVISKGELLMIPSMALHVDKKYYEKPNEFYPEHFTEEAIASRHHFSYLPFGEGPRMCIAHRFARMTIKIALIHFLKYFSYRISPKMKFPIQYTVHQGNILNVQGGLWLNCEKI